jgi:hypothetical protein
MVRRLARVFLVVSTFTVASAFATPAAAQNRSAMPHTPPDPAWVDFGLGVEIATPPDVNQPPTCSGLGLPCLTPRTAPDGGVAASVGVRLGGPLEAVVDASLLRNHWTRYGTPCPAVGGAVPVSCAKDAINDIRSALGGLRFGPISHGGGLYPDIQLFLQVLGGKVWSNAAPPRAALQPGGGIDLAFDSNVRLRFEVDYLFASGDVRDYSTSRVAVWVVMPLTR